MIWMGDDAIEIDVRNLIITAVERGRDTKKYDRQRDAMHRIF